MDREMLRIKEIEERMAREKEEQRKKMSVQQKYNLQEQMAMKEQLRREAYEEYLKEKEQVDRVINKMIEEDRKMQELTRMKQD
jgi:membrane-anchored protein YejM (alkaline phosphatase superfamily)